MQSDRLSWVGPLWREGVSWAVFLLGIALGGLSTTLFAGVPVSWSYPTEWSSVFGFGLLGLVSLLASILALRNRRQAAWLFLLAAPVMAGCLAWWRRWPDYEVPSPPLARFVLIFAGTACLLALPGLFWLVTGRRGWLPLISGQAAAGAPARQPLVLNASLFLFLVLACALGSLYSPLFEPDCGGRPPVSVQTSPRQAVFTARVLFVGRPRILGDRSFPWAVLRVERTYWGLPRWMTGIVVLRGYFRDADQGQEYFVDTYRSEGALTRFLPIVEHYPCCHTAPISDAEVDLRVLREGPPKSSARIIGRVYRFSQDGETFVPAARVQVIGPTGSISAMTDQHGIYDLKDLLPGHYSLRVGSDDHGGIDLKPGDVSGGDLYLPNPPLGP